MLKQNHSKDILDWLIATDTQHAKIQAEGLSDDLVSFLARHQTEPPPGKYDLPVSLPDDVYIMLVSE